MSRETRNVVLLLALFVAATVVGRTWRVGSADLAIAAPGVGVAVVLLAHHRRPGRLAVLTMSLAVLAWLAAMVTGGVAWEAAVVAVSTAAGGLAGALALGAILAPPYRLVSVRALVGLVTSGGAAAVGAAAVVAVAEHVEAFGLPRSSWAFVAARTWLGCLLVGAVVMAVPVDRRPGPPVRPRGGVLEDLAAVLGYVLVFVVGGGLPIGFAALPFTLWVALRGGVARTAIHAALVATVTIAMTTAGLGPFSGLAPAAAAALTQAYVAVVTIAGLLVAVVNDGQRRSSAAARYAEAELKEMLDTALVAQIELVADPDGPTVRYGNPAAGLLFRCEPSELVGHRWQEWIEPDGWAAVDAALRRLGPDAPHWSGEVAHRTIDGERRWVQVELALVTPRELDDAVRYTVQLLDITDRKAIEADLAHSALHDRLTGVANRVLFEDRLEQALAERQRAGAELALIFVDLDLFKHVNDSLGHASGDQVLTRAARRLAAAARAGDTVARVGGDEFVVLAPNVSTLDDAQELAERLLSAVRAPMTVGGRAMSLTMSAGVTVSRPGVGAQQLLGESDAAMYEAKRRGRGRVERYADALSARAHRHLELDQALREAMRTGQFVVHYQPVIDLGSGTVVAVEALVRWNHPSRGLLAPGEWLDVAEAGDLITELGRWVLMEAAGRAAEHARTAPAVAVHVNVSARQLVDAGVLDEVRATLEATGLEARMLVLELTETHLLQARHSLGRELEELRRLGVQIALDDFGTGFSSLRQLVELPIDIIKIDRSFVATLFTDARARAVLHGITAMARAVPMRVVAEGVENIEQSVAVQAAGCQEAQGFLWSAAVPFAQAVAVAPAVSPGTPGDEVAAPDDLPT